MLSRSVSGELCRIRTEDGLELHGFLCGSQKPKARSQKAKPAETTGVLHVHGWDGNFYENRFIYEAARAYAGQDMLFLAMNNRGHDYIADILREETRSQKPETRVQSRGQAAGGQGEYVQIGGMYERMADCVPDIRAGLGLLAERGCRRFILQGHSHGAVKVAHYVSSTRDRRVFGLVLLSPSDDLGWGRKLLGDRFGVALRRARAMARAGKERELLPPGMFSYPVSARTFLDCFEPGSISAMFNLSRTHRAEFPELAGIRVPTLAVVGTVDEAFPLEPNDYILRMGQAMTGAAAFDGHVVSGAPHNYLGYEQRLGGLLGRWLKRRGPAMGVA
jgi:pimeloyl-ACP methyl ester carboxylesterase